VEVINVETATARPDEVSRAAYQTFRLLRLGFAAAPILFGIDKFFNWTVHWPDYLAGWINDVVPGSAQQFMYVVGAVEITAGLVVAVAPLIGAPVVAAWLFGIIVNLLTNDPPEYYDIALRDFGLLLGALALTRLAFALHRRASTPSVQNEHRFRLHRAA
jgi:DoxX